MSDPTLSDIEIKNKIGWVWTTLIDFQEFVKTKSQKSRYQKAMAFQLVTMSSKSIQKLVIFDVDMNWLRKIKKMISQIILVKVGIDVKIQS